MIFNYALLPADIVSAILYLIFSWILFQRIYNCWFHPLANVPGPFFARISAWPSAYYASRGDRHLWIEACFNKYGNKIRITPDTILFRDPRAHRDIYGSRANVRRADFYDALARNEESHNTLTYTNNAEHARSRRHLDLAFTNKSLRAASAFMQKHIDRWLEILSENTKGDWSTPLNFSDMINNLVLDILGDVCYGRSFKAIEPGDNPVKAVPRAGSALLIRVYAIAKTPFLQALLFMRSRGLSRLSMATRPSQIRFFDDFAAASMNERLEREKRGMSTRQDMFHFLYNATDPDTGIRVFDDVKLYAESRLILVAGSDSTSVTMSGLVFYLAHYPHKAEKLHEELRQVFASPEDITPGPRLASCKYARACIDEAMRLSPAGLSELPRQVLPGGTTINDEIIPAGTIIGTAAWSDGRNSAVYGDAEIFRPERWIVSEDNTAEDVVRIKGNFHPFSIGPHNCAGSSFAIQELMLMVAKTVYRFRFRLAPEWEQGEGANHCRVVEGRNVPQFRLRDAYITIRDGPMVQFKRR